MSEQFMIQDGDMEGLGEKKPSRVKKYIIIGAAVLLVAIIIVVVVLVTRKSEDTPKTPETPEGSGGSGYADLAHEIKTVQFPPDIKYIGSHYNYDGNLFITYQKESPNSYFLGIANDEGQILKEIIEVTNTSLDITYIHRASSFSDGRRVLIGGKILECDKPFLQCEKAELVDLEWPEQLKKIPNLLLLFTEPIVNYGGEHIFWSTFDVDMNIFNFVGELKKKDNKYYFENVQGISNYFYDLYDKEKGTYTLPKILKFGPIKQVVRGGEGLSIGGFLDYGLRKGIYQSLSENKVEQLTFFEGYDETTAISPDSKLACVMTTRFSEHTSLEIIGFIPTPYSILASYIFSVDTLNFIIFNLRKDKPTNGNLGPTLVDLKKVNEDKNYKGEKLKTEDKWIFNGFISWAPDGTKVMFDEIYKGTNNRRCQVVKLKNYKPEKIEMKNNFNGKVPYARSIEETINMHLDYPINITVNGTSGDVKIFRTENKSTIEYNRFSEDNENFYTGTYNYEKFKDEKYIIFQVDIKSEGKKNGYCNYRLWFDMNSELFLYDQASDNKNKTYGDCKYDGKEINVDNYKLENPN